MGKISFNDTIRFDDLRKINRKALEKRRKVSTYHDLAESNEILDNTWLIKKKLGGGGFGQVYEVEDIMTGIRGALKLEPLERKRVVIKMDEKVLSNLKNKNHICDILAKGKTQSYHFIIMSLQGKFYLIEIFLSLTFNIFSIDSLRKKS